MQILEAFRALNALNEDVFTLDANGINELSDFKNKDDFEDDISIIDPEAETEEDLQDNYIGKVILDCCVCHSKLYKSKEEVTIDDSGELANVGEECPYCYTPDGFKVIGEVVPFDDKDSDNDTTEGGSEEVDEGPHSDSSTIKESIEDLSMTANDTHIEVTEDESGKVTVSAEPVTANGGETLSPVSAETEAEIMGSSEDMMWDSEQPDLPTDEVDVELDEFDEESMDELGESYFKKVYENVKSFKTTGVKSSENTLIIEGKIKFDNNRVRRTSFMFESKDTNGHGRVRFVGSNKQLTEGKNTFTMTGRIRGKKLIAESMSYNYRTKMPNGKISRVYGVERTSRRK